MKVIVISFLIILGAFIVDTKPWKGKPEAGQTWVCEPDNPFEKEKRVRILERRSDWIKYQEIEDGKVGPEITSFYWKITRHYKRYE